MRSIWLGCIALLLTSCVFGPVKELKYQIEDSWDEGKTVTEPTPLKQIYQKKRYSDGVGGEYKKLRRK